MNLSTMDLNDRDTLLQRLQDFPHQLRAFVAQFDHDLRKRAPDGGFSLVEHLCHLRDLEREGFMLRIRRVLAETMPELQEIDGSTLALERDYQSQDAAAALAAWCDARDETLALLRAALPAQAARTGIYGGFGVVTLASLAQGIAEHDSAHWRELQGLAHSAAPT
jgi:hypothetical protein